jgi:hypothetical protein
MFSTAVCHGEELEVIEGNTIVPLTNNNISMISEDVRISKKGKVSATFNLENMSNAPVTKKIGFPISIGESLSDFKVWVQEQPVHITRQKILDKGEFALSKKYRNLAQEIYVWDVFFSAHERAIVRIEYSVEWGSHLWDEPAPHFIYLNKVGALWHKNIKKVDFYLELSDWAISLLRDKRYSANKFKLVAWPSEYILTGNQIEWHFTNWMPTENIAVFIIEEDQLKEGQKAMRGKLQYFDYVSDRLMKGIEKNTTK